MSRKRPVGESKTLRQEASAETVLIDLQGRTVVPGFIDAHAHIWKVGHLLTTSLDLRRVPSIDALLEAARARGATLAPGEWLQGRGFNEAVLAEQRRPTRRDLDCVLPERPAVDVLAKSNRWLRLVTLVT